jgi:CBS-domain-containing membrane protein
MPICGEDNRLKGMLTDRDIRRLPVIDGHDLVGVVSQADLARNIEEDKVGDLVEAISAAP